MARLQSFKRLIVEDFEEKDRPVVAKIAGAVNVAFEDILNALNKNLTISDNLAINQKDLTVTVDASGNPTTTTQLKTSLSSSCTGITVIRATNLTSPGTVPTAQPFITYVDNGGFLTIQNVKGLQADNKYKLRVILWT